MNATLGCVYVFCGSRLFLCNPPCRGRVSYGDRNAQILDGLEYLHANGVTHRDLKPANVMVSQDGKVKITDFGVSSSTNVQTLGQGNTMVGTPWYIAPEMVSQCLSQSFLNHAP